MDQIRILNKKETEEVLNKLKGQFGINSIPGRIIKRGGEKFFLYQGDCSKEEINEIQEIAVLERIGTYIGKIFEPTGEIRLSIEGTQIFKDQIYENIYELTKEQAETWMQGQELQIQTGFRGIIVLKHENHFMGCGKASAEKITNYIPKVRRLKKRDAQ